MSESGGYVRVYPCGRTDSGYTVYKFEQHTAHTPAAVDPPLFFGMSKEKKKPKCVQYNSQDTNGKSLFLLLLKLLRQFVFCLFVFFGVKCKSIIATLYTLKKLSYDGHIQ